MGKVFEKMSVKDLIYYHNIFLNKLNEYTPDSSDYTIYEMKLSEVDEILKIKKPEFFEDDLEEENIKDDNYEINEVLRMLAITRQTLYNWIKKNIIKIIKIGRKPYVPKSEIERIMKDGTS